MEVVKKTEVEKVEASIERFNQAKQILDAMLEIEKHRAEALADIKLLRNKQDPKAKSQLLVANRALNMLNGKRRIARKHFQAYVITVQEIFTEV